MVTEDGGVPGAFSSSLVGDEATIVLPPQQPPPAGTPPGLSPGSPGRRRRFVALVVLLLAAAGAVTYLTVGSDTAEPTAATSPSSADESEPAVVGDAVAESSQPAASRGVEFVESDVGSVPVSVSSDADGVFTVTVFGTDYVLPGPPSGVRGALLPGEVSALTYDFEASTFVAGNSPAGPFDPSIRQAAGDYEIAWVSPGAASASAPEVEEATRSAAAASGVHIGVVCDGALDAEELLACAERVAGSDADAVILGDVPGELAAPALGVFDEAGLPVVTFDVWHPNAVFVGANAYESGAVAGVNAGRHALDAWGCAGVHVLLGDAVNLSGRDNLDLALTGFADGVRAVCGADVPVSRIETTSDIAGPTAEWLAANPTVERVVATSVTDDLTVDMSRALQDAGRSGIVAAPNAGPAGAARLSEGPPSEIRYLGAATTLPDTYGTTAVAALIDILEGRPVPQEIHTDHTWLNHTNIDQHTNPQNPPNPNPDTPPNPTPQSTGGFTAVTAGWGHSCGLRTDGAIVCWGQNNRGQARAPAGAFSAVSAGDGHSCGLRTDNTMTCWGYNYWGQADAPAGAFTAVTAGWDHSCGLRANNTITCWGWNDDGEADAPAGAFTAVTAGAGHSCGLRTNNAVTCWGFNWFGEADAPAGAFSAVSAGRAHSCGLRTDNTITCWGNNENGEADPPAGAFTAVTVGADHSCGLRTDGAVVCWGEESYGRTDPPAGAFTAVSSGGGYSCGLRAGGAIVCWGNNNYGQVDVPAVAPAGAFTAVPPPPTPPDGPNYTPYAPDDYGSEPCAPAEGVSEPVLEFAGAPMACVDTSVPHTAVFDTSRGVVRVALDVTNTPGTVNSFVNLARFGYHDDTLIHRSDPSIGILQGGSPHTNSATDPGPGYTLWDEGTGFTYRPGQLVMARRGEPNSAGAQYFFTVTPDAGLLDGQGTYVVFGHVLEGLGVLEDILDSHMNDPESRLGGAPDPPVVVNSVTIK